MGFEKKCIFFIISLIAGIESSLCNSSIDFTSISDIKNEKFDSKELIFLKEKIKDKRVILLGERSHTDYLSIIAKARLIDFFHKEMGFNVLLIEFGMFDYFSINKDTSTNLFCALTDKKSKKYFFETCYKNTNLKIDGFDLDGIKKKYINVWSELLGRTDSIIIKSEIWEQFKDLYFQISYSNEKNSKLNKMYFYKAGQLINELNDRIKHSDSSASYIFVRQGIKNSLGYLNWILKRKHINKYSYYNLRDQQMLDNLLWLINFKYPNEKIIISCSNYHITQTELIKKKSKRYRKANPLANKLYRTLDKSLYNIITVSYSGKHGLQPSFIENIPNKKSISIEFLAHQKNSQFGFIDLKHSKFSMPVYLCPSNENILGENWNEIYDGLFFIDEMVPDTLFQCYQN